MRDHNAQLSGARLHPFADTIGKGDTARKDFDFVQISYSESSLSIHRQVEGPAAIAAATKEEAGLDDFELTLDTNAKTLAI